jgi:ATP-binding cassette subfamily B (MDR/TAP) protein 1
VPKQINSIEMVHLGHHDKLVTDPAGAYSQLIQLQEAHQETSYQLNAGSGPLSKRSQSLQRSISRSSAGSSHHSLILPVSLPGPTAVLQYDGTDGETQNKNTDGKVSKKGSIGRLINLAKPETAVLLFGSLAAAIDGTVYPMMGLVFGSAAKTFYELPAEKRKKDSVFWGLLCVGLGVIGMISKLANSCLFAIAGGKLIKRIRALTFQTIVYQEADWFDHPANSR